jgi:4-amino-4-deoxy-L-arabinose transferase-like glycosyltransferase
MSTQIAERPAQTPPAPGAPHRPRWERPSLAVLLASTAVLYLWGLGASGWANGFYSAAVQAASYSWKAFFFGSFDSSNFITVDKPPASLWVMDVSARIFGVSSWSILVPEALMGVASVALLYATVRRRFSPVAGLIAGAVLATTPAAALMFRFNNPDALLTLLLVGAAYAMVRALELAGTRWLIVAGGLIGFAFLAKMLQAFLVVPGFAAVYLFAAPTPLARRCRQLALAGVAMVASFGWWVAVVALTPASGRPYIGGSQHNGVVELILGYNGFGRLTGNETGSVGGGGRGGTGMWGPTGITRLFNSDFGGQVSWLLPAALVFLAGLLYLVRRRPRTDERRAQLLLWGSWLVVTGLTFSLAKGIIHPYYVIALAPAVGAVIGIGADVTWRARHRLAPRLILAGAVAVTAWWSWTLLDRTPTWQPWLRTLVLFGGLLVAIAIGIGEIRHRQLAVGVAGVGLVTALAGPTAYAVETAAGSHTGAIPSAGPAGQRFPGPGGRGGLLDSSTPSSDLVAALRSNASHYRWVAATIGSNNAAGLQLGTDLPVMSIGGFNGTDPTPTLAEFQKLVAAGDVHYFIAGGRMGGPGGLGGPASTSSAITAWVETNFTAINIGGMVVYDVG